MARGFLVIVPLSFISSLTTYLWTHGRAAEAFTPYPFLAEALGPGLGRRPLTRFAVIATVLFLLPYVVTSLLLFLADAGTELASRLWRGSEGKARGKPGALPPESVLTLVAFSIGASVFAAGSLNRVAHGGELPGGVNIAPVMVAAIPFAATALAVVLAALVSIPRFVASLWPAHPTPSRPERR